ncbi:MAG: T9SS type A sorting domain-containing protein [Bacteroidales bacterium]|nr:T9SS type A sorting domain-containing protein [Bacteroidales bacterium]
MKKRFIVSFIVSFGIILCNAQNNNIEWQKCIGGSGNEFWITSVNQTIDEGFIITGTTESLDGDVNNNHGGTDAWIVKFDANGDTIWTKSIGGSGYEQVGSIQQTTDSGYILAVRTTSIDGDVSGNHGGDDAWIVKFDANGDTLWTKSFGGSGYEFASSISQTLDEGYIMAMTTSSMDGDVINNHGDKDAWIVKLDANGDILWTKCLGGTGSEDVHSIKQTTDGDYILATGSTSNNGDVIGNHGGSDAWIVKLNANGDILWTKCLGGTGDETAVSIQQTKDNNYIVGCDISDANRDNNAWIVKLNSNGDILWTKYLYKSGFDFARSVQETIDGSYILSGYSFLNNNAFLVKLDINGDTLWTKCLGGILFSTIETSDGNYILSILSGSKDGDVSDNYGQDDVLIVKLDANGKETSQHYFGGSSTEYAPFIQECSDGNIIMACSTESNNGDVSGNHGGRDFWVVKIIDMQSVPICIVTTDITTGKNKIVWNKIINENISYYKIYRESAIINQYELLDFVFYDEPCIYTDNTSIPERRQYQYKISPVFLNKYETEKSPYHKTLFLQYAGSVNGVNLSWEDYTVENGDIGFISYIIYRGNTQNELVPYDSVPSNLHSYTDTDPEAKSGTKYYRIAGIRSGSCFPNGNLKSANVESYDRTFSNLSSNNITGLYEPNTKEYPFYINVFPNPFHKNSIIQYKLDEKSKVSIELYNSQGECVDKIIDCIQQPGIYKFKIETHSIAGLYYVKMLVNGKLISLKCICI